MTATDTRSSSRFPTNPMTNRRLLHFEAPCNGFSHVSIHRVVVRRARTSVEVAAVLHQLEQGRPCGTSAPICRPFIVMVTHRVQQHVELICLESNSNHKEHKTHTHTEVKSHIHRHSVVRRKEEEQVEVGERIDQMFRLELAEVLC